MSQSRNGSSAKQLSATNVHILLLFNWGGGIDHKKYKNTELCYS